MQNPNIVIIGYGDIGRRVAAHYTAKPEETDHVQAWHRGSKQTPCDLDKGAYPTLPSNAAVFYFAPPQASGETDERLTGLIQHWQETKANPIALVLISTTGIYGDCEGRWIDEQEPLKPKAARAKRRVNAEVILSRYAKESGTGLAILRVPGIYAPDRLPVARLERAEPVLIDSDCPFSNRIHADDLATACKAAMGWALRASTVEAFNICDDAPSTMTAYFNHVADFLGMERPQQISRAEAEKQLSAGMRSYLVESKRIRNDKMKRQLGVELRYPSLAVGLPIKQFV